MSDVTVPADPDPASTDPAGSGGNVLERVRALLPTLAPATRRVGDSLLASPLLVVESTVTELARRCETSETTVVRFCRAVGFGGYPELRLAVASELGADRVRHGPTQVPGADVTAEDALDDLVCKVGYADARAIESTIEQLDVGRLGKVINTIVGARRVSLFGLGASAFGAQDLQQKLLRIGQTALLVNDPHLAVGYAALLGPDDAAIALSHSGETAESLAFLRTARAGGATTIALTNYPHSSVAEFADVLLTTAVRETRFRSGAMASRIAQFALVDCIFVGVAQRTFDATTAALARTHDAVHAPAQASGRPAQSS